MHIHQSILRTRNKLAEMLLPKLYPELAHVPRARWSTLLRHARQTELATTERFGILAAVAISAYALQPVGEASQSLIVRYLVQFALALPLVALLALPWLVRRTRRGLQSAGADSMEVFHAENRGSQPPQDRAASRRHSVNR